MNEDRMDELLREAAQDYHRPPAAPKEEMWAAIRAARAARAEPTRVDRPVVDLASRRRRWPRWRPWMAVAAVLALGIAIGRLSRTVSTTAPALPAPTAANAEPIQGSEAARLATVQHLSRVETLLTEYRTGEVSGDFHGAAEDLLSQTRLWLDAGRLSDPKLRSLLEDLELMLVQIVQLPSRGPDNERGIIDQGMADRQIRARLRAAIPAGPSA